MKTSYSTRSNGASVDSMMTPMIDVVFLLLVFFLSTSSFQRLEKMLPSSAAAAPDAAQRGNSVQQDSEPSTTDLSDVVIRIKNSKNASIPLAMEYSINGEATASIELLKSRLAKILKVRADIPLVIDPEDDVPSGEAIRIYDLAKANGSVAVFLVAR